MIAWDSGPDQAAVGLARLVAELCTVDFAELSLASWDVSSQPATAGPLNEAAMDAERAVESRETVLRRMLVPRSLAFCRFDRGPPVGLQDWTNH